MQASTFSETPEMADQQRKSYLWNDEMYHKPYTAMRCLLLVIALIFCQARLQSQDRYFLFLQTDNEQAFYARIQGRNLSSSANGYLILPRISDATLNITIGFPKRLFPEQTFQVNNIRSDKGFLLKNLPDKGWALIDMQQSEMVLAMSSEAPPPSQAAVKPAADPFSELLSTVIADSSLTETPIVRNPAPSPSKSQSAVDAGKKIDTAASAPTESKPPVALQKSPLTVQANPDQSSSRVNGSRKLLEQIDGSGVQLVFSDETSSGITDTISVWIPKDKPKQSPAPVNTAGKPSGMVDTSLSLAKSVPDRSDCKSFVNAKDLGLLRRRMEALTDEDAKVSLALRAFRESCYATEQIRTLLLVFGREEGRFKLLDAAYPYVLDPAKFPELESVLKDSYFIYRFRKKTSGTVRQ
jgi:hypothetical protein